jgi:hypothetical protein
LSFALGDQRQVPTQGFSSWSNGSSRVERRETKSITPRREPADGRIS